MGVDQAREAVTAELLARGCRVLGDRIRFSCPDPLHEDRHPSADWYLESGVWICQSRGCQVRAYGALGLAGLLGVLPEPARPAAGAASEARPAHVPRETPTPKELAHSAALERLVLEGYDRLSVDRLWDSEPAVAELERRGISRRIALAYGVGFDPAPPAREWGPSLVLPWISGHTLHSFQLRRIESPDPGSRYRWHGAVGQHGARLLLHGVARSAVGPLVVVEGMLKALTLASAGFDNVAAFVNSTGLDAATLATLAALDEEIVLAPDPDAREGILAVCGAIPGVRVANLPMKPDDLLLEVGPALFVRYLDAARRP